MAPSVEILDLCSTTRAYFAPATVVRGDCKVIYISGQVGVTKNNYVPKDYESQIHLALLNLRKIIIATDGSIDGITKLTIYIVNYDPAHKKHTGHIQRFLRGHRPAITLVPVAQLADPSWLFEIDAVVACQEKRHHIPPALTGTVQPEAIDVAIIGAGLAGLSAAHKIVSAGLSCAIFEARDRVGGKLWSQPMSEGGGTIELGAAWINDVNQTQMIDLARRFGVDLIEQNTSGDCLLQDVDGKVSTFPYGALPQFEPAVTKDVARIRDLCEADCQALDVWRPQDTGLDAMTFEEYLRSHGATDTSIRTAKIWTRAMLGLDPTDMSALYFLNYCKSGGGLQQMRSDRKGGGQHLRIRQGTQSIAKGLAAALPNGVIRLERPVRDVVGNGGSWVEITDARGAAVRARKVITTVPSPALRTINFVPQLPPFKRAWSESAGYGFYTKAIVVFKTAFWINKGFCGLAQSFIGPASVVRDTSSPADDKHALTCFMVGPPGAKWAALPVAEREEKLLTQLSTLFSAKEIIKRDFIEMVQYDWTEDKWSGGGCPCTSLTPGVLDTLGPNALREPLGNLHFAGTETAGEWKGYMEGAVRSGERAAKEVVQSIKVSLAPRL